MTAALLILAGELIALAVIFYGAIAGWFDLRVVSAGDGWALLSNGTRLDFGRGKLFHPGRRVRLNR